MTKKLPSREEQILVTQAKSARRNASGKPAGGAVIPPAKPLPKVPAMSDGGEASTAVKRGSASPTNTKPSKAKAAPAKKTAPAKKSASTKKPAPVAEPVVDEVSSVAKGSDDEEMSIGDVVYKNFDSIVERYARGETLSEIGAELPEKRLSALQIQRAIEYDKEMSASWRAIADFRARWYMDRAAELAGLAAKAGDLKEAAALFMKLAEKFSPKIFGQKATVEVTGLNGGPIEQKVSLDPMAEYRRMVEGGQ